MAPILRRLCFVDIETTGLDPSVDEILEIGAVYVERGVVTARRRWLVKPTGPVPAMITALTGLTDEELATAPPLSELESALLEALAGWTLVAHNAGFERSFLGGRIADHAVLDSCEVAQLLAPDRSSHSLDALVRWLEVGKGARHRALDDAEDTFLMLAALCDHVLREPNRERLAQVRFHLQPGTSRDRGALLELVDSLLAAPPAPSALAPVVRSPLTVEQRRLATQLAGWLQAPQPVCAELERGALLPTAVDAARIASNALADTVAIAVSGGTFRELPSDLEALPLPRRAVCLGVLRAALAEPAADEAGQFARAYLSSWLARTHTGDVEGISGFVRARFPGVVPMLEASTGCRCLDSRCFARAAQADASCIVITHEHALDWVDRGAPALILFLEADRLPELERRRAQRTLDLARLEPLVDVQELKAALAAFPEGPVSMRQRVSTEWHAVREALSSLSHALRALAPGEERNRLLERIAEVCEPPPPGLEVFVNARGLVRTLSRPGERLARKLTRGHCLVSSFQGGLSWTRAPTVSAPTERPAPQLEWLEAPAPLERLAELVAKAAPVVLVAPGPLGALAEACLKQGLSISLDAERSAAVQLCEWRRDRPLPAGAACFLYGVREWRRAVLASNAPRVVLLSPAGLPREALGRALKGLNPRPLSG